MITLADIRKAITTALKSKFQNIQVFFDDVETSTDDYFYIEFTPKSKTIDDIYTNKIIKIDIDYVLALDENKKIDRRKLQDSISKIDILFRPIFKVKDRTFTVLETSTTIVDEILHFSFELDFVDCLNDDKFEGINYELMQNLEMKWR